MKTLAIDEETHEILIGIQKELKIKSMNVLLKKLGKEYINQTEWLKWIVKNAEKKVFI